MASTLNIPQGLTLAVENGKVALIAEGDILLEGPIEGEIARIESTSGAITLRGPVQADQVIAQGVRIEGHLQCKQVVAHTGAIQMRGRLDAESAVASTGDIVVRGPTQVGLMRAGGTLRIDGPRIEARLLQGDLVRFRGGTIKARGIEAQSRVSLGPCAFTVEVCIAPDVDVDPKAAGRVNVLESYNELGNNALKGRFRLQEYVEFTGVDPEAFLREREVRPLTELGAAQLSAAEGDTSGLAEEELRTADEPTDHGLVGLIEDLPPTPPAASPASEDSLAPEPTPQPRVLDPSPPPPQAPDTSSIDEVSMDEMLDDIEPFDDASAFEESPETLEPEDLALAAIEEVEAPEEHEELPAPPPSAAPQKEAFASEDTLTDDGSGHTLTPPDEPALELAPETQSFLNKSVARLAKHYAGDEPPAISRLRGLVSKQEYGAVRHELKDLFNSVVRGHIASGTRPHPQVLTDFNAIHDVMKRA